MLARVALVAAGLQPVADERKLEPRGIVLLQHTNLLRHKNQNADYEP